MKAWCSNMKMDKGWLKMPSKYTRISRRVWRWRSSKMHRLHRTPSKLRWNSWGNRSSVQLIYSRSWTIQSSQTSSWWRQTERLSSKSMRRANKWINWWINLNWRATNWNNSSRKIMLRISNRACKAWNPIFVNLLLRATIQQQEKLLK